jgi:hypothetical protein
MSWNPNQPPGPPGWAPPPPQPWAPPPQPVWTPAPQQIPPTKSNAGIWIAVLGTGAVLLLGFCGLIGYFAFLGFTKTAAETACRNATSGSAKVAPCTTACDKDSVEGWARGVREGVRDG